MPPKLLNLYLDDSGTRHPNRRPGKKAAHGYDWFALGGVLINDEDEPEARRLHQAFTDKWGVEAALHSSEIRSQNEGFFWLRDLNESDRNAFYEELYCLMRDAPVTGIACVIDRPGYNGRYSEAFREDPWMLCKTAFSVVVERSVKYAMVQERRLRVCPERCNKPEDQALKAYYRDLKAEGMPFDARNSDKYQPLTKEDLSSTLYDLKFKYKSSPMSQLADLYLWPICMGGYHASNRTYERLLGDGKLIECRLPPEDHDTLGSKYSCFENVDRKK